MRRKSILYKTFCNLMLGMIILIIVIHLSIFFIYQSIYVSGNVSKIKDDMQYVTDVMKKTADYKTALEAYVKSNRINVCVKNAEDTKYYHGVDPYLEFFPGKETLVQVQGVNGMESVLFRTAEVKLSDGTKVTVQLSMNLQQLKKAKKMAFSLLPYSFCVSVIFSLVFAYIFSKKITRPILNISSTVRQMTKLEEDAAVVMRNNDEFGELAGDINILYRSLLKMIDDYKIQSEEVLHMEKERLDYFRGASHELKTPLAKLSVLTENMRYNIGKYKDREKYLDESLVIINELSGMISEILDGVKEPRVSEIKPETVDVKKQLKKILDNYELIAKSKHRKMEVDICGDFSLAMPVSELQKVLSNVIFNAIKYGLENGKIIVTLNDKELCIYNDALPIPEEKLKTIWKGEYILESDEKLKSSGLGLYIVKTILDRYQIEYCFIPCEKGYLFKLKK